MVPKKIRLAKLKSSVDYYACCGLGHRMSKMIDAYYISRVKNFGLRIFWGFCNETTEIFHHFFGAQPLEELEAVHSLHHALKINNESPCFSRFSRTGNETGCKCPSEYIEASGIFYNNLRRRFRGMDQVDAFRAKHNFQKHLVIGLHVRAGNGEQGDFVKKKRGIKNTTDWIQSISNILMELVQESTSTSREKLPPLLFIATDTASIVTDFRETLMGKIPVVDYEQERMEEGSGVAFGEMGKHLKVEDEACLMHWKIPLMDMMILASTDIVVAGRTSSFTQSLPMGVALSKDSKDRKLARTYCEVSPNATLYRCYEDFYDWCCHGTTHFHLEGTRRYEHRRMPRADFRNECKMDHHVVKRPPREYIQIATVRNQQAPSSFLPYDWGWVDRSKTPSNYWRAPVLLESG